jgi:hypothetical protein
MFFGNESDDMSDDAVPGSDGIWTGLLPLKLNTGADKREIDRARLLVRSLRHFWQGGRAFVLHVIGRDDEVATIRSQLESFDGDVLRIIVHAESEFFPESSRFHAINGMYKQQLIKIFVPFQIGLGGFMSLDADVVCIRAFQEGSFIRDGRLISTWESRSIHSWWENSMAGLRAWSDPETPGLGVTPNTLHADICRRIFRYLELRGLDPIDHLCELTEKHPKLKSIAGEGIPLAWSEYSLYTIVGEWFSKLLEYHLSPPEVAATGVHLHSRRNVWSKNEIARLQPSTEDPGHFLVVQSWAGVPVEDIEARIDLALER